MKKGLPSAPTILQTPRAGLLALQLPSSGSGRAQIVSFGCTQLALSR
jgi:hypothetical protein